MIFKMMQSNDKLRYFCSDISPHLIANGQIAEEI
jgi:hypothetical protein